MSSKGDTRLIVLRALAWYEAREPRGIPLRAINSHIDAVERCRLTQDELDDALETLAGLGYAEEVGEVVRLTETMTGRIPRDENGRPSYDADRWPDLG